MKAALLSFELTRSLPLVPAKAGTQFVERLDSRFRGNERGETHCK
jgi:hypothetical protein